MGGILSNQKTYRRASTETSVITQQIAKESPVNEETVEDSNKQDTSSTEQHDCKAEQIHKEQREEVVVQPESIILEEVVQEHHVELVQEEPAEQEPVQEQPVKVVEEESSEQEPVQEPQVEVVEPQVEVVEPEVEVVEERVDVVVEEEHVIEEGSQVVIEESQDEDLHTN
jgi:hypothetical protein